MRTFESGATRDRNDDKYAYEGFLSPLVLERYAAHMHAHRRQADGTLRDADNWQKGIPMAAYQDSLIRHVIMAWKLWRGWPVAPERVGGETRTPTLEDALCAILFNAMGMLHELLRHGATPR
jgi:hypothetical protein